MTDSSAAPASPALNFEVVEGGTGPHMLMIHGMLSDRRQWSPNLDTVKRFARPVLIELWGHGDSPSPTESGPYEIERYLDAIDAVRRAVGAERVLLCGQSFGAALTLNYSIAYPERVIAQIFTNSTTPLLPAEAARPDHERAALIRFIRTEGRMAIENLPFHPRLARRLPPEIKQQLLEAANHVDPDAVASAMEITGPRLNVHDSLGRIACPTLLVNGVREGSFQVARDIAEQSIPGCEVVDIVTAGHAVNIEAIDEFNEAVAGFLARVA